MSTTSASSRTATVVLLSNWTNFAPVWKRADAYDLHCLWTLYATGFTGPRTSLAHGFLWPTEMLFCDPCFLGPGHEVFLGVLAVLIRIHGCCDLFLPVHFYLRGLF